MLLIDFLRFSNGENKNLHEYDCLFNPIEQKETNFNLKEDNQGTKYISKHQCNQIIIFNSKTFKTEEV